MQQGFTQHSDQVNAEAREWFTLMQSGSVSELEKEKFEHWHQRSEANQDAYRQLDIIWNDLAELSTSQEGVKLQQSVSTRFGASMFSAVKTFTQKVTGIFDVGFVPQMALSLAGVAVIAGMFYLTQMRDTGIQVYVTGLGEIKEVLLDDGSRVTMGAKSRMRTWADADERHVRLESGQAFFVVTKDPERPFWVDANDTRVKVVGTQFDVHTREGRTRVAVLEGIVNVMSATEQQASIETKPVVLTAGQQTTRLNSDVFQPVQTITENELSAWRSGRLIYRNANLVDVIADINRYYDGEVSLESHSLSQLKVTATVRTDQLRFFPEMLSQTLPIQVEKLNSGHVVISARH